MAFMDWFSGRVFKLVHGNNLVYNTCWEDPRLDHVALEIGSEDRILVITSAGCNALDYALSSPAEINAVDMNPRQNALLELKLAGIRKLQYEDFFEMFGKGHLPNAKKVYHDTLRGELSEWSQAYWDRRIKKYFQSSRRSFYYRGTSGAFARMIRMYVHHGAKIRPQVDQLLAADTVEEQHKIYWGEMREKFWTRLMKFALGRDTTLSMVGVPKAQRRQIETQYEGGITRFIQDCMDAVFSELPLKDNYFWRVYITGHYTPDCCPNYLKPENFEKLQGGLADCIRVHTDSVQGFLEKYDGKISRFVLLDHMDWLADRFFPLLESEWQAIIDRAAPNTRLIWRSGGLRTDFLDAVEVNVGGELKKTPEILTHHSELAAELHVKDRVHTYGSFYIADLKL